jgi:hypothetical protein
MLEVASANPISPVRGHIPAIENVMATPSLLPDHYASSVPRVDAALPGGMALGRFPAWT